MGRLPQLARRDRPRGGPHRGPGQAARALVHSPRRQQDRQQRPALGGGGHGADLHDHRLALHGKIGRDLII